MKKAANLTTQSKSTNWRPRNNPIAYLYLGNAHFQKKEWDRAEAYYKKAVEIDPNNADAHNNLAWLYYSRGENLDDAERLALAAINLNPSKEHVYRDTLDKIRQKKNKDQGP